MTGIVWDPRTGNPLAGAQVRLLPLDKSPIEHVRSPFGAQSKTDGTFSNTAVTIGGYRVQASLRGYCPNLFRSDLPLFPLFFRVAEGQPLQLRLPLVPCARISGRVVDGAGNPLPGAQVRIDVPSASPVYVSAFYWLVLAAPIVTDLDGEFSFLVPPGAIHLLALNVAPDGIRQESPREKLPVIAYYPSAADLSSSQPLLLHPAQTMSDIEIVFRARKSRTIHVSVLSASQDSLFVELQGKTLSQNILEPGQTSTSWQELESGRYKLRAGIMGESSDPVAYGPAQWIDMTNLREAHVDLTVGHPIHLSGLISPRPESLARLTHWEFSLFDRDFPDSSPRRCLVAPQGQFECPGLAPSRYRLVLPDDLSAFYPKSLVLNSVQRLRSPEFDLSLVGRQPVLHFGFGPGAVIQGKVSLRSKNSLSPLTKVYLFSEHDDIPIRETQISWSTSDNSFRFDGLSPGFYRVLALDPALTTKHWDAKSLASLLPRASKIELTEGANHRLDLAVIDAFLLDSPL